MANDREHDQNYYNNYLANLYPMFRPSTTNPQSSADTTGARPPNPGTPWEARPVHPEQMPYQQPTTPVPAIHRARSMYPEQIPHPQPTTPVPAINRAPPPSNLTEDERTRQQMLMLLQSRPASEITQDPSPRTSRSESSYRIDWPVEEPQSPISSRGAAPRARNEPPWPDMPISSSSNSVVPHPSTTASSSYYYPPDRRQDFASPMRPRRTYPRSLSLGMASDMSVAAKTAEAAAYDSTQDPVPPDDLPPPYERGNWNGPVGPARDSAVVQANRTKHVAAASTASAASAAAPPPSKDQVAAAQVGTHPAFRESRFLPTGGNEREERRKAIEAASRRGGLRGVGDRGRE